MASALLQRLAKIESVLAPSSKQFSVERVVIIYPDTSSERLPIADAEWARLKAKGYREGVDELIVLQRIVEGA